MPLLVRGGFRRAAVDEALKRVDDAGRDANSDAVSVGEVCFNS